MDKDQFAHRLISEFPYTPTNSQLQLIHKLSDFIINKEQKSLFVLKGYAGTGKTTILSLFVKHLYRVKKKSVLLAPTGRAAKVFSAYSGKQAFTIHKKIYFLSTGYDGSSKLILSENKHTNTIFIVDEASMIPDNSRSQEWTLFSTRNLLEDLFNYVYNGENCKLILLGDTAQLPPVGLNISPALDIDFLNRSYSLELYTSELTDVVRQSMESGILANATNIRKKIKGNSEGSLIVTSKFDDIIKITGEDLEDLLNEAYSKSGLDQTVIITRSNKRANNFN
ncbi:MAG: AAA family ATPase, partial [Bacteroidales bacterium]|nr:AAA family ATPase [Bacteroidales bacterium]